MNLTTSSTVPVRPPLIVRSVMLLACLVAALGGTALTNSPKAAAAPGCSDVAVIFARGTAEPAPPIGLTGQSFVSAVRSQLPGKTVSAYGVNYPASSDFNNRLRIAESVADGVTDAQNRAKFIARTCPDTKIVLGGYSQGAAVAGYATSGKITIPDRYREYEAKVPPPLPADVAKKVAAVVLYAPPSDRWIRDVGAPPIRVGASYAPKTVRYCIPGDTICNGAPVGQPNGLHVLYTVNGDTLRGAQYVASRV